MIAVGFLQAFKTAGCGYDKEAVNSGVYKGKRQRAQSPRKKRGSAVGRSRAEFLKVVTMDLLHARLKHIFHTQISNSIAAPDPLCRFCLSCP